MADLNIAEVPFEDGTVHFRYMRYLSEDGSRWIRHGMFVGYHPNGEIASEGEYVDGQESGLWVDYHDNGRLASRGFYDGGKEAGLWEFWDSDGAVSSRDNS